MISSVRQAADTECLVIEGAMDAEAFVTYIQEVLAPTLVPQDIVIMDNLSSHKNDRVRQAIERVGAHLLYLPAYSPDLNPIEKMGCKVKTILRSLRARTPDTLLEVIGTALNQVRPSNVAGWPISCGYEISWNALAPRRRKRSSRADDKNRELHQSL
jgi:transposase